MFRQMTTSTVKLLLQRGSGLCKLALRQCENHPQVAQAVKNREFHSMNDHTCAFWDTRLCMRHTLTHLTLSHVRHHLIN